MKVGDLVQVDGHPGKWFRVVALDDGGNIEKLSDVTNDPAVKCFVNASDRREYRAPTPAEKGLYRGLKVVNTRRVVTIAR